MEAPVEKGLKFRIPKGAYPAWEGDPSDIRVEIHSQATTTKEKCSHCGSHPKQFVDIKTPMEGYGNYNRCIDCIGDELRRFGFIW